MALTTTVQPIVYATPRLGGELHTVVWYADVAGDASAGNHRFNCVLPLRAYRDKMLKVEWLNLVTDDGVSDTYEVWVQGRDGTLEMPFVDPNVVRTRVRAHNEFRNLWVRQHLTEVNFIVVTLNNENTRRTQVGACVSVYDRFVHLPPEAVLVEGPKKVLLPR